jgi:hypothetical protein
MPGAIVPERTAVAVPCRDSDGIILMLQPGITKKNNSKIQGATYAAPTELEGSFKICGSTTMSRLRRCVVFSYAMLNISGAVHVEAGNQRCP